MSATKHDGTKKYPHAPDSEEWEREANNIALQFAPNMYPCSDCGGPVAFGFCCTHCGSSDPRR